MPLYNAAEHLPEALESLLAQSRRDIAVVLVDDGSEDETEEIVSRYLTLDDRLSYTRNEQRLGLALNWRRVFELATELHPQADLFAWGSDHDVWSPRFAAALIEALDASPKASAAYSDDAVIRDGGLLEPRAPSVDTSDIRGLRSLLRALARKMRAGQMVYGVFRIDVLRRAGGFRHVLYGDRLVLTEAALQGPIVRVPQTLWYKRPTGVFGIARQRHSCFPDRIPLQAYLPWWVVHAVVLAWMLGVRGRGRPSVGRLRGLVVASIYLYENGLAVADGKWRSFKKARRRRQKLRRAQKRSATI